MHGYHRCKWQGTRFIGVFVEKTTLIVGCQMIVNDEEVAGKLNLICCCCDQNIWVVLLNLLS